MTAITDTIKPVDKVDGAIIAEAAALLVKFGGARNDATIKRADMPKLILGCCLDDNKPKNSIASIKAISKINLRCVKPLSPEEIAVMVSKTNELISNYLEVRNGEAKQRVADKKKVPDAIVTKPVKDGPPVKVVDIVNGTTIANALITVSNAKNGAVVTRDDLPKIILGCCLGDDNKPRDTVPSIKAINKINERVAEPLTAEEISSLVSETNNLIFDYLETCEDAIKKRVADKKETERKKAQDDREKARAVVQDTDPEILKEAHHIYQEGKFLEYCKTAFNKVWLSDSHILMGVLLTVANMRVQNATDGVHLHIMGTTQSGKSDSVKAAMRFVHDTNKLIKSFSMKYLFYADDELPPCSLVFSDDTTFDPDTASLYRNMLTSWFTGVTRGIVVNHASRDTHIPARVSLILTSIESVVQQGDDGQDESRFLSLEVRRTPEQMAEIRKFVQQAHEDIQKEIRVIHAAWTNITPRNVTIHKIVEMDVPIREFKRFLTLVQAYALLHNRTTTIDADFTAIEKFLTYSKPMIDSMTPAFTRKEAAVRGCLSEDKKTMGEIVAETKMSLQDVYRAVHGRDGTFQNPKGGLMAKEPKLEYTRQSSSGANDVHLLGVRP